MATKDQVKTLAYKLMHLLTRIYGVMINTDFIAQVFEWTGKPESTV